MNKSFVRFASFSLSALLTVSFMTGCGSKKTSATSNSGEPSVGATTASNGSVYPLKTDVTIKWFMQLFNPKLGSTAESDWYKELNKRTGVKVEFINVPIGKEQEQLNILVASGDLPDIVQTNWNNYAGGAGRAISDGVAMPLNDVVEKWAPNYAKLMKDNPEWAKLVKTDDGKLWSFAVLDPDPMLVTVQGPIIRKDWLDDLGLPIPETIDDWYVMLKAFKEKKGATAPLCLFDQNATFLAGNGGFVSAFGTLMNFYQDGGKVKYGPLSPAYKEFLATFRKWYAEGLLDKDFATTDNNTITARMTGGASGATIHNIGGGMGTYLNVMKDKDPKYNLTAAPFPVLKKGTKPMYGTTAFPAGPCATVTAKSKNTETAVRLLNYCYTDEGHMLNNFGIEGVSYNMVNGYPTYTDAILKNPKGYTIAEALGSYCNGTNLPGAQDKRYMEQYFALPQQKAAGPVYANTDVMKYKMPPVTMTADENQQYSKVMADINTYIREMYYKIIMGTEPLENADKIPDQLKKLGIDNAITVQQAALDRFNKR